jgi:flavodoxin
MNTLVVYDSQFGNTEKIARRIADTLGEFGTARAMRVTEYTPDTLKGVELLVIGCPTQAWHSTKVAQTFITELGHQPLERLVIAAFDTRFDKPRWLTGSAALGMEKQLKRLGAHQLPPESFLVTASEGPLAEGELDRAVEWARSLHHDLKVLLEPLAVPA